MIVVPSTVTALWSVGPAPPRLLGAPALESSNRRPCDWSSESRNCFFVRSANGKSTIRLIEHFIVPAPDLRVRGSVDLQRKDVRSRVVTYGIHHPFPFRDQPGIEFRDGHTFAFGDR